MTTYMTSYGRNRPWTPGAIKFLKKASRRRTRVIAISQTLKRTETALRQKARLLGLPLGPQQRPRRKRRSA